MRSLPHLCDTGSGQHAGNASDKALLAGGVEAAEALPGLLEVVLLQCMEQPYFCTQFCLAWATPGPIQHIVIGMSCLPCHPMAPQDTEAALALLHDSMSTQQCLHNEKGTCCRRTLLRTRTAQGGHRAACLAHCRLLMFGVSCVSLSAKKAPRHRRAPAHLADDGLLPTP